MKIGMLAALGAAFMLAGCGSLAQNADVPQGVYVGGRATIADTSAVKIVDTGPSVQDGGRRVGGTSCKNKVWDPAPSRENAIALMKRQASELGFNAIHSVEVRNEAAAVMLNCWSAIVASGIAFHQTATAK